MTRGDGGASRAGRIKRRMAGRGRGQAVQREVDAQALRMLVQLHADEFERLRDAAWLSVAGVTRPVKAFQTGVDDA